VPERGRTSLGGRQMPKAADGRVLQGSLQIASEIESRAENSSAAIRLRNRSLFEKAELMFFSAVGFGCAISLLRLVMAAGLPFELGTLGEGIVLSAATRIARGLSLYPPITQQLPFVINVYGPVAYYLGALCVKLFGVSFTAPRILVALSAIWSGLIIALLMRRWGGAPRICPAFGLLYVAMGPAQAWMVYYRADLIGIAFSLTGLYIYTKSRRSYLSVPFFITALLCKFTLISAPFACFVYALSRKQWRKALGFAACGLALGSLLVGWIQRATGGWFLFHTILSEASNSYSVSRAFKSIYKYELNASSFLIVLGLALAYNVRSRPDLWLPLIYLGSTFLSLVMNGKEGAAGNYFLENYAALCLCAGMTYHLVREQADYQSIASALVPAALAAFVMLNFHSPREPAPFDECARAYDYVRSYRGAAILSDNVGAVVLAGKPLLINDPFMWSDLAARSEWRETRSNVVELIRSHQIGLILLGSNIDETAEVWPESVLDATRENYVLARTFTCPGAEFVYQPRPQSQATISSPFDEQVRTSQ
jgi:hypothetical protein